MKKGSGLTVQGIVLLLLFGCVVVAVVTIVRSSPEITRFLTTGW